MPYDQARLHYEIGRHLPTDDPARGKHLEHACALFEQMGATYDLARAAEALGCAAERAQG
jgi:eukaryotic-like serine/threonine-protein kinase